MVFLPQTGQGWVIDVNGEDWYFDPLGRLMGRPDPDTYDPCWCASGEKFRFCHKNRHRQPKVTRQEYLAGWEAAADIEMCLHPAAPVGCSAKIVRAHTVQRMGGGLRVLAQNGDVYGFKGHPYFFQKNDLRVVPERIGTRIASTFRGFCADHDASLFKAVEHRKFAATSEQLALLNFRVIARRVFGRHVAARHAPTMLAYDRGLPPHVQREWFAIQHREIVKADETLKNTISLKGYYDRLVLARDFAGVNAYVAYFSGLPVFLCAELVRIDCDFIGGRLNDPPPPAHLCVYNLAVDNGWALVFSWMGVNGAAEMLAESFSVRSDADKPGAAFRYALEYTDNVYFAPEWWEGLTESERGVAISALTARMHPHYVRDRNVLRASNGFPLRTTFVRAEKHGTWDSAA